MAAVSPTAVEVWASLSVRERVYLAVLFDVDEKAGGPEGWRWLDFGGVPRGSRLNPIQRRLKDAGVLSPGAAEPVERLSGRGLLRIVRESGRMVVRLTAAARDAACTAVPARYLRRPPGLLSREAWRCLTMIHAAGPAGWPVRLMPRRERRRFERHRVPLAKLSEGSGVYFDMDARRLVRPAGREPVWSLTPEGREHHRCWWRTYSWLYPEVIAMDPAQQWGRQVRAWCVAHEQFPDDIARAIDQLEHVLISVDRAVRTAERGGLPSTQQWRHAVVGDVAIPIDGWDPWVPMRDLETELERNVSAYWAGLDRIRWRFASCFAIVASEVAEAALAGVRPSLATFLPFVGLQIGGSGRPLLLPSLVTGDAELDAGIARSRAVATAAGATPEDLAEFGRHLVELVRRARLVDHSPLGASVAESNGHAPRSSGPVWHGIEPVPYKL